MRTQGTGRLIAIALSLGLVAAACGGGDDGDVEGGGDTTATTAAAGQTTNNNTEVEENTDARVYGGTIAVGLEAEAVGLRPWEDNCSSPCYNIMITIYDKLMEQAADGSYAPYLAESLEPNAELTEWTLTLRDGVTFHNGVALTGQTLVDMFPLQQAGASAAGQVKSAKLTSVAVDPADPLTVVYTLSGPNAAFPSFLSRSPLGMVFEPAAAAADPDGYSTAPIGTGPFIIEKRDLDNETVVVRNDDYWGTDGDGNQMPFLDSIVFRPIPDEGTRLDSLLSGTVDAMQSLRQATVRDARAAGDQIERYELIGNNTGGGHFNTAVPPLDDVRVRLGLVKINRPEAVIEALGGSGISEPATQWFSPTSPWWTEEAAAAWPTQDIEAGTALIQEYIDDPARSDGLPVGSPIEVELTCPPDPTLLAAMQVMEQLWTSTGLVQVNLTNFDQQTHINNALGAAPDYLGTHQAACWRWSGEDDPSIYLNPAFAPVEESPQNFANYYNEELFGILSQAVETSDVEERKALYSEAMLILARDVPVWYSGHTAMVIATEPSVQGVNSWTTPDGVLGSGFTNAEVRWQQVWVDAG